MFLLYFAQWLQEKNPFPEKSQWVKFPVVIPALLNVVLLQLVEETFDELSVKLTNYENHQSITDYEDNYIMKRYLFSFFSLCGPLI